MKLLVLLQIKTAHRFQYSLGVEVLGPEQRATPSDYTASCDTRLLLEDILHQYMWFSY